MRLLALALILFALNLKAENPKLFLKNIPIKNNLIIGVDLEAIMALQSKFEIDEADDQIDSFKSFVGVEPSELSALLIAGSGDFANPKNESGFVILKGNSTLHAEKILHSTLKNKTDLKARETKFNNHPVYLIEAAQAVADGAPQAVPMKDMYLSSLSDDTLIVGGARALKEVLSTVKFDKMLSVTSSSQMMKIMDDKPALLFIAFSFDNFLSTTAGQALALSPVAQGIDFESLTGLMFNADYNKEAGLSLSLDVNFFSIDARKAFESKMKQLRNQQKEHIQHGTLDISGGSNKLTVTYVLKDDELTKMISSIRNQITGVVPDADSEEIFEEDELDIPEEIE